MQNAGKSSLINAMRQAARLPRGKDVTAAPLPGTTLGMLRVPGLLPTGCKMLDTPGVPHAFQVRGGGGGSRLQLVAMRELQRSASQPASCIQGSVHCHPPPPRLPAVAHCIPPQLGTHLTAEEMHMVLPKRPLKPRTFRLGAGQVGGRVRLALEAAWSPRPGLLGLEAALCLGAAVGLQLAQN